MKKKPLLVTTEFKGVFYGYGVPSSEENIELEDCRNAIYWATTRGFLELATTGPNKNSRIGSKAQKVILRKVTSVTEVTQEAAKVWDALP